MNRISRSIFLIGAFLGSTISHGVTLDGAAIKGELSVEASGAAGYSIPILIPPGPGGFSPSLSLAYNSQQGNDYLGQGWSLGGFSSVTRCPMTMAQDGKNRSVAFDDQDALCLDGARLVFVRDAAGISGFTVKEYATEIESFSKVVAYYPTSSTSPAYFKVWRKSGIIDSYGYTADSRIEAGSSSVVKEWRLNRREDRRGNYFDATYSESVTDGEVVPAYIDYGANSVVGQAHLYRIAFSSEARSDARVIYRLGFKESRLKRLGAISISKITNGAIGAAFRSYSLGYQYSQATGVSRLSTVTLCGQEGATQECAQPTTISWHELPGSFSPKSTAGLPAYSTTVATDTSNSSGPYKGGMLVDLNNDGRPDYVHSSGASSKNVFMLNQPDLSFSNETSNGAANYITAASGKDGGLRVTDFNHDGYTDLVQIVNGVMDVRCGGRDQSGFHYSSCTTIPAGQTAAQAFLAIDGNFVESGKDGGLRLVDINDDGIDDLVLLRKKNSVSYRKVYIGSYRTDIAGGGKYYYWYENAALTAALPQAAYFVDEDKDDGLRIFDIDGNGRPDLVKSENSNKVVYLNRWAPAEMDSRVSPAKLIPSASFESAPAFASSIPLSFVSTTKGDSGVRFVDLNGDGLVDILRCKSDTSGVVRAVHINTGSGFLANDQTFADSIKFDVNLMGVDGGTRFADVNGDGLVDAVESTYIMASGTNYPKRNVYWNDGTRFVRSTSYSSSLADLYAQLNGSDSTTPFYWLASGAEVLDLNGDGYADLVQMNSMGNVGSTGNPFPYPGNSHQRRYQLQDRPAGVANDKIASICDGLGFCTSLKYAPLTDSTVYTPSFGATLPKVNVNGPLYVVASVEESLDGGVSLPRVTEYRYGGMVSSTDRRVSLGFAERTVTVKSPDPETGVYQIKSATTTTYSQDWPYVGMPLTVTKKAGDALVVTAQQESVFGLKVCDSGQYGCAEAAQTTVAQQEAGKRYLPYVAQSVEHSYGYPDGAEIAASATTTVLDAFGNLDFQQTQLVEGGNSYSTSTDYVYELANTGAWYLAQKSRVVEQRQQPNLDGIADNDSLTRTTDFSYFPANASDNLEGLLKSVTIEPNDATGKLFQVTSYTYDEYGNVTSTKVAGAPGAGLAERLTQQAYTGTFGRFPTSVTNPKGFLTSRAYHSELGSPAASIDPNNIKTMWSYDLLGRERTHDGPDDLDTSAVEGSTTTTTYAACGSDCLPGARYTKSVSSPALPESMTFYDGLNRVVGTRTRSLDGSYAFTEQVYNADGQIWKKSQPYFAGSAKYWTTYEYDAIGRPSKVTDPAGHATLYAYSGNQVVTTNPLLQRRTEKRNALGQLISVTDDADKILSYFYDAFGNLSLTRDSKGNEVRLKYDGLGRKIEMRDPDLGLWSYSYNAFGELTSQTDARNWTTQLEYDVLGRLVLKSAPDMISTWTYDQIILNGVVTPVPNGRGRLVSVSADNGFSRDHARVESGAVQGGYDSFGNALRVSSTIDGAEYAISYQYDNYGRLAALTYPGGAGYRNGYSNGYLNKVSNLTNTVTFWEAKKLTEDGRVAEELLGNGLATRRTYKPETRMLESVRTGISGVGGPSSSIQNEYYDYDALNNLWLRFDSVSGVNETFLYDNRNRLTSAQIDGLSTVAVTYDEIGNITSKTDAGTVYTYGPSGSGSVRPHAVTAISGGAASSSFSYDANGNMLAGNLREFLREDGVPGWSSFNKPIKIVRGAVTEHFLYDAEYERAKRVTTIDGVSEPQSTIVYLNPRIDLGGTYEREVGADGTVEQTYHIYAGNQVVGAYVVTGGAQPSAQMRYFHVDSLGSITATTDDSGVLLERLSYDAWGKRRLLTSSQASIGGLASLQLPAASNDPNHLISRDAVSGFITFKTNGVRSSQPYAVGQNVSAQLQHTVQATLAVGKNYGQRRNFEFAVENSAARGTSAYRRYGLYLKGASMYRRSCIGALPCADVLLGPVAESQYLVNITTTRLAAQLSVQQQGVSGSISDAMTVDWTGGAVGLQEKHVIAGLGYRLRTLMIPQPLPWPNAPIVLQGLTEAIVTPQDGSIAAQSTRHGFTGHEMLDDIQLVHMNGRVYDPVTGRMQSPDPTVTEERDQQSFNRYSYARNSPLNFTDPSGFTEQPTGLIDRLMNLFGLGGATSGAQAGPSPSASGAQIAGGAQSGFTTPQGVEQSSSAQSQMQGNNAQRSSDVPCWENCPPPPAAVPQSAGDWLKSKGEDAWDAFNTLPPHLGPGEVKIGIAASVKLGSLLSLLGKGDDAADGVELVWKSSSISALKPEHIFSADHVRKGIMELGATRELIVSNARDALMAADKAGALREGINTVVVKMNGLDATVRGFIKNGELLSLDIFKGISNRAGQYVIDLR